MLPSGDAPYIGLIRKVAKHLIETSALCRRRIGRFIDDYVGVGYLGLLKAQEAYQPGRGARFTTYAFVVIRHFMMLEAFRSGSVRLPTYIAQEAARLVDGRPPTATAQRRARRETLEAAAAVFDCEYRPLLESQEQLYGACEGDYERVYEVEALTYLGRVLDEAVASLDEPAQQIIVRHYGLHGIAEQTLQEIANSLGLSRDQVWLRKQRALARLRGLLDEKLFGEALSA